MEIRYFLFEVTNALIKKSRQSCCIGISCFGRVGRLYDDDDGDLHIISLLES